MAVKLVGSFKIVGTRPGGLVFVIALCAQTSAWNWRTFICGRAKHDDGYCDEEQACQEFGAEGQPLFTAIEEQECRVHCVSMSER